MRGSTKVLEYIPYPPTFPPSPRPPPPLLTHAMTHAAHLTSCMCTHRVINTCNRRAFSLSIPTHRLTREKLLVLAASERLSLAVSQSAGVHAYSFLSVYILHTHREKERERSYMEQNLTCIVKRIFNLRCSCCKNYGLLTRFKADQLFLNRSGTDAITCPFSFVGIVPIHWFSFKDRGSMSASSGVPLPLPCGVIIQCINDSLFYSARSKPDVYLGMSRLLRGIIMPC